jgi:hypothetical protein
MSNPCECGDWHCPLCYPSENAATSSDAGVVRWRYSVKQQAFLVHPEGGYVEYYDHRKALNATATSSDELVKVPLEGVGDNDGFFELSTPATSSDKADIIHKIRVAMACCCSEHRQKLVNKLVDQLEKI